MSDIRTLEGSHIILTGATGFVGQAVLERLLSGFQNTTVSVIVRPRGRVSAQNRMERMLKKSVFNPWREAVGDDAVRSAFRERVEVIEGDLGTLSERAATAQTVIHTAASVTFDPPIDTAFTGNVGGAEALYRSLVAAGADPHVVHVSTCYVNGALRGLVPERSVEHDVDWRTEREAAVAARRSAESASRSPAVLGKILKNAESEVGKIGPHAVAQAAERGRREWVEEQLVEQGRARARSLGWTDAYTFSKALAERVAEEMWAAGRLSMVRPAIIESALRHPFPGWIDGFKVADPLILAYGKGRLKDFPGLPDSVLDIVPVDFVVNAILAAAAAPPRAGEPQYFHVASGARNPLSFQQMYETVNTYFTENPLTRDDVPVEVPAWDFPGSTRFDSNLRRMDKGLRLSEGVLANLPRGKRAREGLDKLRKLRRDLGALRKHAELYQVYVAAEVVFDDAQLRTLNESLPAEISSDYGFDMGDIGWTSYLAENHIPAVLELAHAYSRSKREAESQARQLTSRSDALAVFDLEGTLLRANLVDHYRWLRMADRSVTNLPRETARLVGGAPRFLAAEKRDRSEFIRTFMRLYKGMSVAEIRRQVRDGSVGAKLHKRLLTEALERAREHRRMGHRTVLVTGTIDLFADAVAPYFDEVIATRMQERDGILTGFLGAPPLVGEARAAWLRHYAEHGGYDLSRSYGYGDSFADTSWLELLGHPTAVNPDSALYQVARERHWQVVEWDQTATNPETK